MQRSRISSPRMGDSRTGNATEGMKSENIFAAIGVILMELAKLFNPEDIYFSNLTGNFYFY